MIFNTNELHQSALGWLTYHQTSPLVGDADPYMSSVSITNSATPALTISDAPHDNQNSTSKKTIGVCIAQESALLQSGMLLTSNDSFIIAEQSSENTDNTQNPIKLSCYPSNPQHMKNPAQLNLPTSDINEQGLQNHNPEIPRPHLKTLNYNRIILLKPRNIDRYITYIRIEFKNSNPDQAYTRYHYACRICNHIYPLHNDIVTHIDTHFMCPVKRCKNHIVKITGFDALVNHINKLHTTNEILKIRNKCRTLAKKHATPLTKTPSTNKSYHSLSLAFCCHDNTCCYLDSNITKLRKHEKDPRLKAKVFKCKKCHYIGSSKSHLALHNKISDHKKVSQPNDNPLKYIKCKYPNCGFQSCNTSRINIHVSFKHSAIRPYKCDQCNARFKATWHLKRHINNKHSNI